MEVAERNSRLLLVVGGVGLSGVLINFIGNIIKKSYSTIKINEDIPLSVSQLFSSLLLASYIVILGLAIIYCYFELFSYSNLTSEKKAWYMDYADKFYLYILRFFAVSFVLIILIITGYAFIHDLSNIIIIKIIKIIGILIILIYLFSFWSTKLKKVIVGLWTSIKSLFNIVKSLFTETFQNISIISCICWMLCFIVTIAVGIETNTDSKMNFKFDGKNYTMTLKYEDKVRDFLPEEFKILIKSNGEIVKETSVKSTDFNSSYINVVREITNTSKKEEHLILNKNNLKFSYEIQLKEILDLEEGTVYIQFDKKSFLNKDKYIIANYFEKKDNKFKFDFPEINLDF